MPRARLLGELLTDVTLHAVVERPLVRGQLQVVDGGAAVGEADADVGAAVADHHLGEEGAQVAHVARLARVGPDELPAEGARGAQQPWLEDGDHVVQLAQVVVDRRGRQHQHVLLCHAGHELVDLRRAVLQLVGFVDDQEVVLQIVDDARVRLLLGCVQGGDHPVVRLPVGRLAGEDLEALAEFGEHLLLPLRGERRRHQDEDLARQPAHNQLLHDDAGLNRLAEANLVAEQHAGAHLLQGGQRRLELVGVVDDINQVETEEALEAAHAGELLGAQAQIVEPGRVWLPPREDLPVAVVNPHLARRQDNAHPPQHLGVLALAVLVAAAETLAGVFFLQPAALWAAFGNRRRRLALQRLCQRRARPLPGNLQPLETLLHAVPIIPCGPGAEK